MSNVIDEYIKKVKAAFDVKCKANNTISLIGFCIYIHEELIAFINTKLQEDKAGQKFYNHFKKSEDQNARIFGLLLLVELQNTDTDSSFVEFYKKLKDNRDNAGHGRVERIQQFEKEDLEKLTSLFDCINKILPNNDCIDVNRVI